MTIARLSDTLINQIAAGEVVERPASVLKELVENALDAGATRVDVLLADGGCREICVIDNGVGMNRQDLELSIERHATSKLRELSDLESMETFGFRGEALASIASVARLQIRSRETDSAGALTLEVEFGTILYEPRPVAGPVGTAVTVRDLFERVPARKKFMKSPSTELSHCTRVFRELALGNPHARFYLHHQGQQVRELVAADRAGRFREAFAAAWEPLVVREESPGARLEAYLSPPGHSSSRGELLLYINDRGVRNRLLLSAVRTAYMEALGPMHEPTGALFLDLRSDWIDVNVHPQKLEVRCLNESSWYAWLSSSLRKALAQVAAHSDERETDSSTDPARAKAVETSDARFLGRVGGAYLVCEDADAILVLDPSAVLERIRFDELLNSPRAGGGAARTSLSVPKVLRPQAQNLPLLETHRDLLESVGLAIEPFGDGDIAVHSVPEGIEPEAIEPLLARILDRLRVADRPLEAIATSLAEAVADRLADALSPEGAQRLSARARELAPDLLSPTGKPLLLRIDFETISKHFVRKHR